MKPNFTESPNLWLRASRTYTGSDQGYAMYRYEKSHRWADAVIAAGLVAAVLFVCWLAVAR